MNMKINSLEITNLGPFKGSHSIELGDVNNKKNITIFGGENGSGKTTIFNLIKLAIHGPKSLGFITNNKTYKKMIKNLMNNSALKNHKTFSITIELKYTYNFKDRKISIARKWDKDKQNESILVKLNNKIVRSEKKYELLDEIFQLFPLKLLNINLFDGEKINQFTLNNDLYNYIENVISFYFNIDITKSLEQDLNKYIRNLNDTELNSDELKLKKNIIDISSTKSLIKKIQSRNIDLILKKEKLESKLDYTTNEILDSNLVSEKKKESLLKTKNVLSKNYKNELSKFLDYISTEIVYIFFNKKLMDLVESFKNNIDKKIDYEKSKLINRKPTSNNFYNQFSFREITILQEIFDDKVNTSDIQERLDHLKKLEEEMAKITTEIKGSKASDLVVSLENINIAISEIDHELDKNKKDLDSQEIHLEILLEKNQNLNYLITKNKRSSKSLTKVEGFIRLLEEFKSKELEIITDKLSELISNHLSKMHSLQYNKIEINSQTRSIFVYIEKKSIALNKLSAGERQMIIFLIFNSIVNLSSFNYPIILDTPMARLDEKNKNEFSEIIKNFEKNQILVFSTDREVDNSMYTTIKERVSKAFMINKIEGNSYIQSHKYFGQEK